MTQPKARRGRPPSLTREQIAKTVLDVGFANLTFAAVRDRLGVGETTLYRYAPDRDELVRMGLEYAYSGIEVPSFEGPWREVLTAHALNTWHSLEKYPGAATEVARGIVPHIATYFFEELCVILIKQGFTAKKAVLTCDMLLDMVIDSRRSVEHSDAFIAETGAGREEIQHQMQRTSTDLQSFQDPGASAERQEIRTILRDSVTSDPLEWLRHKMTILLDGIEYSLKS